MDPDEPLPDDWLRRTVDDASGAQRDALRDWTGPVHRDIQSALYGQAPLTEGLRTRIDLIDAALARTPLPRPVRVQRMSRAAVFGVERAQGVEQAVGTIIDVSGYLSTSLTGPPPRMRGPQRVLVELLVPSGTPAGHIQRVSAVPEQRELLLARGLTMVVTGARYDQRMQRWIVNATVAPGEATP